MDKRCKYCGHIIEDQPADFDYCCGVCEQWDRTAVADEKAYRAEFNANQARIMARALEEGFEPIW